MNPNHYVEGDTDEDDVEDNFSFEVKRSVCKFKI